MEKIWEIAPEIEEDFQNKFPEINPIILQLLFNRGLKTQKKIDEFLFPDYSQDLHDPFLFKNMKKAVNRIFSAIEKGEKMVVCGDYDADGITASAILFLTFKKLGAKKITVYIPDRETDGYGLNKKIVEKFIKDKVDLIITCDCGTTNFEEIKMAKKAGIDVIVTDHHCPGEGIPQVFAIINPQIENETYPFHYLAGVGVAFKLIQGILKSPKCQIDNKEGMEKWFLDLVAIGTVADSMPILGENRTLVKYGLIVLNKSANIGLRFLIKKSGLALGGIETNSIVYYLSPRLNAAARIKHAEEALKLILTEDEEKAKEFADNLNDFNKKRQVLVERVIKEIRKQIDPDSKDKILVLLGKDWPKGILGLAASKLLDEYYRPVIIISQKGKEAVGSGRSIPNLNLHEILSQLEKYFSRFGGHPGAVGLTLKDINLFEDFKKELNKIVEKKIKEEDFIPKIKIDAKVKLKDINWDFYESLVKFEPFGRDNWQPNFLLRNVVLNDLQKVGQKKQHCRLIVGGNKKMIYFCSKPEVFDFKKGDHLDVIFQLGVNQWNGQQELQFKVIDIKKS